MLHIVNKALTSSDALQRCLNLASKGSSLLLIENGVFNVLPETAGWRLLQQHLGNINIYALSEDLEARGLNKLLPDEVQKVNYNGFVALTAQHEKSLSWN
ncbi:sulfurtransferase complex subunit TusB [Aestuariirhabdus sp. Z084]|uniref:sulfurtransferase complex subunit TusB n=1 Tax=Aestuariirhabdus haliotis TaxID=2918751 RepID=UPI00201B3D24|nr:sulfurtransferase complex subunit TusB [Aestuariirhabdus haliotis]MCL6414875.1 sulfurtransferase complex subunit TusB [Aestuariirhabdus haliotis]MCL6418807.1 sulfurtransferase complex subunit TusB [Aestuariirhabdus haliotis]